MEAIALGHDLGHTPFGHAGEYMLNSIYEGGFKHNEQSVRIVETLEKNGEGLNLTWEVRDGILNHQTRLMPSTMEGKIVRLSDKIAYINHDIDDAIRGKVLSEKDLPAEYREILGNTTRKRLNTLIHNIITNSLGKNDICMSEDVEQAMKGLRKFMFENVYRNSMAKGEEERAKDLLNRLFYYYNKHIDCLPKQYLLMLEQGEERERVVCDYIAGMTDRYAIAKFEEYFMPKAWQIN